MLASRNPHALTDLAPKAPRLFVKRKGKPCRYRTTQLYDRCSDGPSLGEYEKVRI